MTNNEQVKIMSFMYVRCGLSALLLLAAACPDDRSTTHSAAMSGAAGAAGRASGSVKIGSRAGSAAPASDEAEDDASADDDAPSAAAGRSANTAGQAAPAAHSGAGGRSSTPSGASAGKGASQGSAGRAGSASGNAGAAAPEPAAGSGEPGDADADAGGALTGSSTLDEIQTNAQAEAVCDRLRAKIRISDFDTIAQGSCALQGLVGELQGEGVCSELVDACLAQDSGTSNETPCTVADFPHCTNVTVDEYVACSIAAVSASADYFGSFSCDTDPASISDMPTPDACVAPYRKCPELGGSSDTDTN